MTNSKQALTTHEILGKLRLASTLRKDVAIATSCLEDESLQQRWEIRKAIREERRALEEDLRVLEGEISAQPIAELEIARVEALDASSRSLLSTAIAEERFVLLETMRCESCGKPFEGSESTVSDFGARCPSCIERDSWADAIAEREDLARAESGAGHEAILDERYAREYDES